MIDRKTVDQIMALEEKIFLDDIEYRERLEAVKEAHPDGWYEPYCKFLEDNPQLPFFMTTCVMDIVYTDKVDRADGSTTVTYHYEWDYESMNAYPDGVQWAKDNGLVIPLAEDE